MIDKQRQLETAKILRAACLPYLHRSPANEVLLGLAGCGRRGGGIAVNAAQGMCCLTCYIFECEEAATRLAGV